MKRKFSFLSLLTIILILSSCANYKIQYTDDNKNWNTEGEQPDSELSHTLFLVSDAGYADKQGTDNPALVTLEKHLAKADEKSHVVFLGDNIYPSGMPQKGDAQDRREAEARINNQLDILENYNGRPIFIPGNHDWNKYGLKGLRRQEKYIEKKLNAGIEEEDDWENYFLPDNGCGGPEVVEVNDNLTFIVIDSNWFLRDWNKDTAINDGCDAKNRRVFELLFEESIRKNRTKNVVVLMHHPLFSYGPHGGSFPLKQHIFPLTELNKNLYIPLPILGSAALIGRGKIGTRQDLAHPDYRNLKRMALWGAGKNGNFIFASGHEHALQYIEDENKNAYIVSGAGSKKDAVKLGKGSQFAYGGLGFSKIQFYKDGTAWVEFWRSSGNNEMGELIFRKKIRDKLEVLEEEIPQSFPVFEATKGTIVEKHLLTREVKKRGAFYNGFMGKHYRETYAKTYRLKTLDLSTYAGGLTPLKRGGGGQTNSVRFEDSLGRQFTMRNMTKDASRLIPYPFNQVDLASSIVEDSYLATFPFSPIVLPKIADAAKVYHTNPKIFYVPKQPQLAEYNEAYGDAVYLMEERPVSEWEEEESFGKPLKIINTDKLVSKKLKNYKHKVDQEWALRSRLFDIMIGDFDRHDDQWRWALISDENDVKTYRPIPRDRDQPFSNYDGFLTKIANDLVPFLRLLKPYKSKVFNIKWQTYNGRIFDNSFISEMDWEDWEREVKFIQANVTDEVIDEGFAEMPLEAQETDGEKIKQTLRERRDNMMDLATRYYKFLAKEVDVTGSEKKDLFEITRLPNGDVDVKVYDSNSDGDKQSLEYHRVFHHQITKEINIYGLGDDDIFNITGKSKNSILVRAIGCLGDDTFNDSSEVNGLRKKTHVYDSKKGNELNASNETKDKRSNRRDENIYDREHLHYEYDFFMPLPSVGFNRDDGLILGANAKWTRYKFKKFPYSQLHYFQATAAFSKASLDLLYKGEFIKTFGSWDATIDARFHGDRFAFNYFGYGNDTEKTTDDLDFHRVQSSLLEFNPSVKRVLARRNGAFLLGGTMRRITIVDAEDRFISNEGSEDPTFFDAKLQLGIKAAFKYSNVDNPSDPNSGIKFHSSFGWETNTLADDVNVGKLKSSLAIYYSLDRKQNVIFAAQVGMQHNFGKFRFYDSAILGGIAAGQPTTLRGYRAERFYGNTSFYNNYDLRIKLYSSKNNALPFSMGIHGGYDFGRVWADEETSDKWHSGYGGGLWVSPVNAILIRAEYFLSAEDELFSMGIGFAF